MIEKRVYTLSNVQVYQDKIYGHLVGIFTNKKLLLDCLLQFSYVDNCYVKGIKKNKQINQVTLNTSFVNDFLVIYDEEDKVIFQIRETSLNKINFIG